MNGTVRSWHRLILAAVILFGYPAVRPLGAQVASVAPAGASGSGPTFNAARSGVAREASTTRESAAVMQSRTHHGQAAALMIVGGIAVVLGLVAGGGAGPVLVLGGAALGLYGLYLYLL